MNDCVKTSSLKSDCVEISALKNERLPPSERLKKQATFARVFRKGKKILTSHFLVHCLKTENPSSRIGIVISGKVAKAHARNRIRRLLREAYRREKVNIPPSYDIVINVKNNFENFSYEEVRRILLSALRDLK